MPISEKREVKYDNGYYKGEFKYNKKNGSGMYYWHNGNKYIGEWKNDNMHGKGILYIVNGD
jgi:hypothetical protein